MGGDKCPIYNCTIAQSAGKLVWHTSCQTCGVQGRWQSERNARDWIDAHCSPDQVSAAADEPPHPALAKLAEHKQLEKERRTILADVLKKGEADQDTKNKLKVLSMKIAHAKQGFCLEFGKHTIRKPGETLCMICSIGESEELFD